jgi:hypothetical protein
MSCPTPEALAMWVDDGRRAGPLEVHVAECASCAQLVSGLCEDQVLFLSGVEALPEDAYAEVRQQVLARVSSTATWKRRWFAAMAGAAVACGILVVSLMRQQDTRPAPEPVVAARPPVPQIYEAKPIERKPASVMRAKRVRKTPPRANRAELIAAFDALFEDAAAKGPGQPGQTVITMQTQDPNVTILLLTDSNGDGV